MNHKNSTRRNDFQILFVSDKSLLENLYKSTETVLGENIFSKIINENVKSKNINLLFRLSRVRVKEYENSKNLAQTLVPSN